MEAFYKTSNYALIRQSDMLAEMKEEALDICTVAIEKHSSDLEKATQVSSEHKNALVDLELFHACKTPMMRLVYGKPMS